MTEFNTVIGSIRAAGVHPCARCRALVEACGHWHPGYVAPPANEGRARRTARERERRAAIREGRQPEYDQRAATQTELIALYANDTMGALPHD